jgi:TRAP-type mannitol/chloroaromatic compound transport system substrate-binding protein
MFPLCRYRLAAGGRLTILAALAIVIALGAACTTEAQPPDPVSVFNRISTFFVFENTAVENETVAEIVAASQDGNLLIYTDSATENVGFVDITDAANPVAAGTQAMGGEPTSVAVSGQYALVAVNTSESFVNPSGRLKVIDLNAPDRPVVADIDPRSSRWMRPRLRSLNGTTRAVPMR